MRIRLAILCLLLWLASSLGAVARAEERAIIGDVQLRYPEGAISEAFDIAVAELKDRPPLLPGSLYDERKIRDTIHLLYGRDVFSQVRVWARDIEPGVVALTIELTPRVELAKLRITGNRLLDDAELRRGMRVRIGEKVEETDVREDMARIAARYHEQGYMDAHATFETTPLGPYSLEGTLHVEEGRPRRVRSIRFTGDLRFPEHMLRRHFPLDIGDTVSQSALLHALKQVRRFYAQQGSREARVEFVDGDLSRAELSSLYTRGEVVVHVENTQPVALEFVGTDHYRDKELQRALGITDQDTTVINAATVEKLRKDLLAFYQREGYLNVKVAAAGRLTSTERRLRLRVFEGKRLKLDELSFHGARGVKAARLRDELLAFVRDRLDRADTSEAESLKAIDPAESTAGPYDFEGVVGARQHTRGAFARPSRLDSDEVFIPEIFNEGARVLEQIYREQGFLSARVAGPFLDTTEEGERLHVSYDVREGVQTRLSAWRLVGLSILSEKEIRRLLPFKRGMPLNDQVFPTLRHALEEACAAKGYLFAQADFSYTLSPDDKEAKLLVAVREGPLVRIHDITVQGARLTRPSVILNELTFRLGDVYLPAQMERSQRFLQRLGVFQAATLHPDTPEREEAQKDVLVTVIERKPGRFELSGGLATDEGVRGGLQFTYRNLAGAAVEFHAKAHVNHRIPALLDDDFAEVVRKLSPMDSLERELSTGFYVPSIFSTHVGFHADLIHIRRQERSHGLDKNALQFSVETTMVPRLTISQINEFYWQKVRRTTLADWDSSAIVPPDGSSYEYSPKLQLLYDARDDLFDPTKGYSISVLEEYAKTLAGSLPTNLFRHNFYVAGYLPIALTRRPLVLRLSGRLGLINNLSGTATPIDKRFKLGGRTSLRGFDEDSVYPSDLSAAQKEEIRTQHIPSPGGDAFVLYRLDLRMPLYGHVYLGSFVDSGALWMKPSHMDTDFAHYKNAAGGGVHYRTPVGDISLEMGFNLHRQRTLHEDPWRLHFSISIF